jgi:hypothetical protein
VFGGNLKIAVITGLVSTSVSHLISLIHSDGSESTILAA